MKLLIATRADNKIKTMANFTHPIIKAFANKWDADFLILGSESDAKDCSHHWGKIHYRIMKFYDLLSIYDRIIQLDSDLIINKNCPNLFDIVPYDKIGTIFEDIGCARRERLQRIALVQKIWGKLNWNKGYINTGVFIVSRQHKEIFKKFNDKYWMQSGFDDVLLGYQIHRLGFKIFELDWRFNHMSIFSDKWNGNASRFDSYIMHYAGQGAFSDKGKRSKTQLIKDDIERIYGIN